jgi:hypothetical protein
LSSESPITTEDDGALKDGPRFDGRDGGEVLPPIDATPLPDVNRTDCPDADATLVYVVTQEFDLYSFYPPTAIFTRIGHISCPAPSGTTPFSMAVDRKGAAYVAYVDETSATQTVVVGLYRVSTATAACIGTPFIPRQRGFLTFGMGFVSNTNGPDETLFLASDEAAALGTIDAKSFVVNVVGPFQPPISRPELTGTGDGRLFAFYQSGTASAIAQVDKSSGNLVAESPLPAIQQINHWAFAFWGGDFYTFTGPSGTTDVNRFRPLDNSITLVTTLNGSIVGAGVSTCAPEQ